jgi:replicative DNA helicase
MSRTYALAFIFATVTLVSVLFYGQYWYFTGRQAEVSAFAAGVHERIVERQLKEMRRMAVEVTKGLKDETKERFRPIQGFIYEVEEKREAYLKLSRSIKPTINDSRLLIEELVLLHNGQLE